MQHGRAERRILEASNSRGQAPPPFIANAPVLLEGLQIYLDAFRELSTCRSFVGMNGRAAPIPWTAIHAYAVHLDYDYEDIEYFVTLIRALDDTYLEHMLKKADDGINKPGKPAKVPVGTRGPNG